MDQSTQQGSVDTGKTGGQGQGSDSGSGYAHGSQTTKSWDDLTPAEQARFESREAYEKSLIEGGKSQQGSI